MGEQNPFQAHNTLSPPAAPTQGWQAEAPELQQPRTARGGAAALLAAPRAPGAATGMKDLLFKFTSEIQPLPEFPGSSDRQQEV